MGTVIAFANQKGGVAKTTSTYNVGVALARAGKKTLMIDLDSQASLTISAGLEPYDYENTIVSVLQKGSVPISRCTCELQANLYLVPSRLELAQLEVVLIGRPVRETILRRAIDQVRGQYDYILIDCHPALDLLTVNAMAASDAVIVPVEPESYAVDALGDLWATIERTKKVQPQLHVGGIVITRADPRRNLTRQMTNDLREAFSDLVYQTVIPYLADAPKAASACCSAVSMKDNRIGEAYRNLAKEVLVQ